MKTSTGIQPPIPKHPTTYTNPPNCWHDVYNTNVKTPTDIWAQIHPTSSTHPPALGPKGPQTPNNLHMSPQLLATYNF